LQKIKEEEIHTLKQLSDDLFFCAAIRASNPPSSCPINTTEENPISEQNDKSSST